MEQRLINALIALLHKAGGECLVKDLIRETDENNNPATWTAAELEKAIDYIQWQTKNFGAAEAIAIVEALLKRYDLRAENFVTHEDPLPEHTGVQGLQ